jgi:tryptophan synthase alpha chain
MAGAGVRGAIVPDLPLVESEGWEGDAAAAGIETVLLAAPVTPDDRLAAICARSRGFVYGVGLMGVTGSRTTVAASSLTMAKRLKAVTDKPVLIGFGVSTPDQARALCEEADGVVIASALMRRILDGESAEMVGEHVAAMRSALDAG